MQQGDGLPITGRPFRRPIVKGFPASRHSIYGYSASTADPMLERSRSLKAADRPGLVIVDVENGIKFGNLQQVVDFLRKVQQFQLSSLA